jgi:hypothetical protein
MSVPESDTHNNTPSPERPSSGPGTKTTLIAAFAGTAVLGGVLAAGAAMPAVGSIAAVANTAIESFESFPTKLGDPILPQRSVITDA